MPDNIHSSSSGIFLCWFLDVWYEKNNPLKIMQYKTPLTWIISLNDFNVRISSSYDKASLMEKSRLEWLLYHSLIFHKTAS